MDQREEEYVERTVVNAGVWQIMRMLPRWLVVVITLAGIALLLFSKH